MAVHSLGRCTPASGSLLTTRVYSVLCTQGWGYCGLSRAGWSYKSPNNAKAYRVMGALTVLKLPYAMQDPVSFTFA